MGHITHNAIVVTSWCRSHVEDVRVKALQLGLPASEAIPSLVNAFYSVLVGPDGSKSGWAEDAKGETARASLATWLRGLKCGPGWVEVSYGNDDQEARIEQDAWRPVVKEG